MKKIIICLTIIICLFMITGCKGKDANKGLKQMSYEEIEGIKKTEEDSGKLKTGEKWQSVRYILDEMVVRVVRFEDRRLKDVYTLRKGIKDKKINDIDYKYTEMKLKDNRIYSQYYTQVGDDTYYITATYTNNKENKEKLDKFLKSITIQK